MYENIIRSVDDFMKYAISEAFSLKSDYIGTEHILLAFFKVNSKETQALVQAGADYNKLKSYFVGNRGYGNFTNVPNRLSKNARALIDKSMEMAFEDESVQVLPYHLLMALTNNRSGFATEMLEKTGADIEKVNNFIRNEILAERNEHTKTESAKSNGFLSQFAINLNEKARNGNIDPVISRDKEIDRILQVLLRRTKNNPVLIGEAGVGKTAIAEGLALRIVENKVPEILSNREIYSIDLASMLAGSKYRGDFEKRIKGTLEEVMERKNVILFLDEFHNIVGTGGSEGSIDASNILKPFLARGEIQLIGATTITEYRKNIEKDTALERRLQPITVNEPSVEDSIKILQGLRERYEKHHSLIISNEAIKGAVELSNRYLTDRFLPDKAIDLIDEAGSMLRMKSYLKNEDIEKLREEINGIKAELKDVVLSQDFLKAQELKNIIEEKNLEIENLKEIQKQKKKQEKITLNYNDVAKVVSDWSLVPVNKITSAEGEKYLKLSSNLKKIVIGQDRATELISSSIKRARAGVSNENKPIGSFIFVGATGVGKTYLAKSLAKLLFDSEENMIRVDMSEYMEKHTVSKLIGSPPGYVGYGEGGYLTEAVRRKPYSVLLFDEIEKAHPDVFNMLLQILDDGRLTDSQGKVVNFKNTIIIMTSNVGANTIERKSGLGFSTIQDEKVEEYERIKEVVNSELKNMFKPEFLNRIDDIIIFSKLTEEDIEKIAKLSLDKLKNRLKSKNIDISFSKKIIKKLAEIGYDKKYGARPLERAIKTHIEDKIAEEILKNEKLDKLTLKLDVKKEEIVVSKILGK